MLSACLHRRCRRCRYGYAVGGTGPDPVLSISAAGVAGAGSTLAVPVNLNHSDGLTGINLAIAYDTSRLTVTAADVQRGSLTGAFDNFTVTIDAVAGIIRIEGYHTAGPLDGLGSGSVAMIDFHVKANAPAGAAFVNLLQNAGPTWTLAAGTDGQGNEFLFDLEPRPSNAAGNVLDGSINVTVPAVTSEPGNGSPALVQTVVVGDVLAPLVPSKG